MLLRVGHGKRTDFVLIFRPDGALAEEREHAACVCKRERCAARFCLFSRRSARRLVSFSSLLLSSLLSFVSFDENVPFEKKDDENAHKYNYNAAHALVSHATKILHPPYNSGFLQQRRQPFDFFSLREIVDVFQSGLFQFFLRLSLLVSLSAQLKISPCGWNRKYWSLSASRT